MFFLTVTIKNVPPKFYFLRIESLLILQLLSLYLVYVKKNQIYFSFLVLLDKFLIYNAGCSDTIYPRIIVTPASTP